jgi:chromate reductase
MNYTYDVAVLVGSLRRDSVNRKLARTLEELAPPALSLRVVEIGQLPLYNPDDDGTTAAEWSDFRSRIAVADAVLFVTPEYNRSVPAALKNALDVGSRPSGGGVWNGKPGGVVTVTTGQLGGFGANHHLRQTLMFLNVPTMQQPEAYVSGADKLFDAEGRLVVDTTRAFLERYMNAFAAWVARFPRD